LTTEMQDEHSVRQLDHLIKQAARGGGIAFIGSVIGRVVTFGLHILLGRVLGPGAYGLYALGLSVAGIAQAIGSLGLNQGVVRFCAMYRGVGDSARVKKTVLSALCISLTSSVLIAGILFALSDMIAQRFFHELQLAWVLRVFALALPFYVLMGITASFAQSFRRIELQTGVRDIFRPLTNLALVSLAFIAGSRLPGAVYSFLATGVLSAGLGFYCLFLIFPNIRGGYCSGSIFITKALLRFSLPLLPVGISYFLLTHTDRIMLGIFNAREDVGIYTAAATLAMQFGLIHNALVSIFGPIIADLFYQNRCKELSSLYKTIARWDMLFTALASGVVLLFSRELMLLYGGEYAVGSKVLKILLASYLVSAAVGPTGTLLQMSGKQDLELMNSAILLVLNIVLNLLLIPLYGIRGAAFATVVAFVTLNSLQLIEIKKLLNVTPFSVMYWKQALPLIVTGIVLNLYFGRASLVCKGVGAILWVGVLILFLYQTRSKEDDVVVRGLKKRLRLP